MPVGTQATVKSQTVDSLKTAGANVLLANTYHLLLRPGPKVLEKFGGIHAFMNWNGPVLTDSGGFQIFSLPHSREMNEEGAVFQSYVDKKSILLSPELSIQTQRSINSDIMMVLDQCIPSTSPYEQAKSAMELTHRWAMRSLIARGDSPQALFAIVQGACFPDLRKQSSETLRELQVSGVGFDGFAVGGLAVGESKQEREDFTKLVTSFLPEDRPRYLMGVGTPIDILEAVHRGIDMFDCILPSQLAQRGVAFTSVGKLQLRRSVYKFSEAKLDPECTCLTCSQYSRAYLHHLNKTCEVLGWHLIALHNFTFYHKLLREIRQSILENRFMEFYQSRKPDLMKSDEEYPSTPVTLPKKTQAEKRKILGDYEVHTSALGFSSIRNRSSGEIMHSVNPPEIEARELYIKPSQFQTRLQTQKQLVIWDVGLGAATNAVGAIQALTDLFVSDLSLKCETKIVSFEIDLDPLRLALKNPHLFPYLKSAAPHHLLKDLTWKHEEHPISWSLHVGDFLESFPNTPRPDLIFYDPFSFKTNARLWQAECFKAIFEYCKGHPMQLMTYSASTLVRTILLSEGFYVGYGPASGPKTHTTVAFNTLEQAKLHSKLLGAEWLARYEKNAAQMTQFEHKIRTHPQF